MKAWTLKRYGSTQNLQLQDIPTPIPRDEQVLIQVQATSLNDWDGCLVHGKPFYIRLLCGLFRPGVSIPGVDVAGYVVEVGEKVTQFRPGDAVYGDLSQCGFGSFAEYVCAPEDALALMPPRMSFIHAAALPHAGMLAVQGLRAMDQLEADQRLLINGAGGGVGTLGIQIAQAMGIEEVCGVDHKKKLALLDSLGFWDTLDYQTEDFTKLKSTYDLILDAKTTRSLFAYAGALKPAGKYITLGGHTGALVQTSLLGPIANRFGKKRFRVVSLKPNKDLDYVSKLYETGKLKPVIDGPWNFADLPLALDHFCAGNHRGKVIISTAALGNTGTMAVGFA